MSNAIVPYVRPERTREEIIDFILMEMAAGRSLNSIVTEEEGMPSWTTFWRWYQADAELEKKVARAREIGIEALMETALHVATTPMEGMEETIEHGSKGVMRRRVKKDMLGHRRLAVDTIIKRAQMMKPKTYGPRLDLTSDGEKLTTIADGITAGNKRLEERTKNNG